MFNDFKTSILGYLKERTSTPLWPNFILVWCIYNWHILIIIFYSDSGNASKIIEKISNHDFSFWWPFIWAILVTLIIPGLNNLMFWVVENLRVMRNDLRISISGREMKDKEKFEKVVNEYNLMEQELKQIRSEKIDWNKERLVHINLVHEFNSYQNKFKKLDKYSEYEISNLMEANQKLIDGENAYDSLKKEIEIPKFLLYKKFQLVDYSKEAAINIKNGVYDNFSTGTLNLEIQHNQILWGQSINKIIFSRVYGSKVFIFAENGMSGYLIELQITDNELIKLFVTNIKKAGRPTYLTSLNKKP
jgi:hypothetical protein